MAKELVYRVRLDVDAASFKRLGVDIENSQERAEKSVNETTSAINRQAEASENASRSQRNFSKATSNANQTLFTFGDLINDAQQFQFGFAQGSRAIGNNIAFAAEQISNTSQRAGGLGNTLKALGSSLLGPGGIILAVNLAVTAITVFGDALFSSKEKAEDFNEELGDVVERIKGISSAINETGIFGEDPFGILETQNTINRLNQELRTNNNIIKELSLSEQELNRLKELRNIRDADGLSLTAEQTKELRELAGRQQANADIIKGYTEDNKDLKDEIEDLNLQLANQKREQREANDAAGDLTLGISELGEQYIQTKLDIQGFNDSLADTVNASIEAQRNLAQQGVDRIRISDSVVPERDLSNLRASEIEAFQNASQQIESIKRDEVQTRIGLERQALTTISSIAQAIAPKNKALAISLIAIEKGIRIAQVITSGIQKAAAAEAQALLFLSNPATAPLAGQAFASANAIRAQTAAAAALIAAQGFAEGAQALGAGGSSGGGAGGRSRSAPQQGFQTSSISRNERDFANSTQQSRQPTVIVEANNVLPDTEFSVRAERGRKRRTKRSVVLQSDNNSTL